MNIHNPLNDHKLPASSLGKVAVVFSRPLSIVWGNGILKGPWGNWDNGQIMGESASVWSQCEGKHSKHTKIRLNVAS